MADAVHTRRAMLRAIASVAVVAAMPSSLAASSSASLDDEIAKAWAAISPLQRKFMYDELYRCSKGEPNIIDKTAEYTFEEWLGDIPQWERDMIARAFKSPDIRNY